MSLSSARRVFLGALVVLAAGHRFLPGVRLGAVAGVGILGADGVIFDAVGKCSARLGAWLMLALAVGLLWLGWPPVASRDWPMILGLLGPWRLAMLAAARWSLLARCWCGPRRSR
jgi:hypothetical protein